MIPAWCGPYVGLPYADKGRGRDGADCWGGVRMVLAEIFAQALPDYGDAYTRADDWESVSAAVAAGLADGWHETNSQAEGDLVIVNLAGRPWHCGVMVNATQFLHWPPPSKQGVQQLSCIERLDSMQWAARKKRFYRHGR